MSAYVVRVEVLITVPDQAPASYAMDVVQDHIANQDDMDVIGVRVDPRPVRRAA